MAYRPTFTITAHLLTIIEEIASLRERIVAATVQVPWIPLLQKDTRARNTHGSTAIEGNPLTLEQVRALEEGRHIVAVSKRSEQEVLNYFAGLRFIERRAHKKPIAEADVLKLHAIIAKGAMDQGQEGVYRRMNVTVGHHRPPPPADVPELMSELLEWWNTAFEGWSPVLSSAILHYRFEEIHPFADGNGRIGRTLALWELYRRGFDTHHIFSIDEVYWENRPRYYKALSSVKEQRDDLTSWLEFAAEVIHLTLEKVWVRVQKLSAASGSKKVVLRPKQEQLLQMLRHHGGMTPREIWEGLGVSKQGAMDLLHPLIEAGLVSRIGTKKSGRYILT
jgi:cell filamentation protein, protein adenylyltransferase